MKIFISGGCKNGKSYYAQYLAKKQSIDTLYYIATMKPVDKEDEKRIKRHQQERAGWGFMTIEQPDTIDRILTVCRNDGSFLLDSLTALLANEMFLTDGQINEQAADKISKELIRVLSQIQNIVLVSDFIYSDAMEYDQYTEAYRKSLAYIDKTAAKYCDIVLEVSYGNIIVQKGRKEFEMLYEKDC